MTAVERTVTRTDQPLRQKPRASLLEGPVARQAASVAGWPTRIG